MREVLSIAGGRRGTPRQMMNAGFPFERIADSLPRYDGVTTTYVTGLLYFYTFIFFHYFVLLNMVRVSPNWNGMDARVAR